MPIQALNNFVFIVRDEMEKEKAGLIIPGQGQEKPNHGTIFSVGELVQDKKIKNGKSKKCLFFKGTGFEVSYDGQDYLVIEGERIIAVL